MAVCLFLWFVYVPAMACTFHAGGWSNGNQVLDSGLYFNCENITPYPIILDQMGSSKCNHEVSACSITGHPPGAIYNVGCFNTS